jgi:protein-arginine kinase activator protein McsA
MVDAHLVDAAGTEVGVRAYVRQMRVCDKCGMTYVWVVDVASAGVCGERERSGLQTQMRRIRESVQGG